MKTPGESILASAKRLAEAVGKLNDTGDNMWVSFLWRESNILLRRVLKFWWGIRFRGKYW